MGGKTKQTSSSTQTNTAYAPVKPVIDKGASMMGAYLDNPSSSAVYGGPRVADLSKDTRAGLDLMRRSSGANQSMGFLGGLLSGGAGETNPQVAQMVDKIRRDVLAANASQFSRAGMTGGTQHQESLSRGLADGMSQPLFAAFENDMGRKMQAAGLMPQVDQQRIGNQLGAGQIMDSWNQSKLNADRGAFEENRTAALRPWTEVAPYATQLGSAFGTQTGNSTSTTKQSQSPAAMIGGGLMAGAGVLSGMPGLTSALGLGGMFGQSSAPWQMPSVPYASNGMFNLNSLFGGR